MLGRVQPRVFEGIGNRLKAGRDTAQFVVNVLQVKFLSYKIPACHADRMNHEPNWKDRARAVEYWMAAAVVAGSFVAGLVSAVRVLIG